MDEKEVREAIERLHNKKGICERMRTCCEKHDVFENDFKFYEKDVETYDLAIEALEKQLPKKVVDQEHFGCCPMCHEVFNSELLNEYNIAYCPWCGKKLNWSE